MCTPSPSGNPSCGDTGPSAVAASAGGDVDVGGGNPINLISGNKYQLETDMAPLPGVLGLELKRHYNSRSTHSGLFGANWRMSYETVLYDFGGQLEILQADGQRLVFQRGPEAGTPLCTSPRPQDGQVRIERDGSRGTRYLWRWPDGRTLLFTGGSGGGHPLQAITAGTGEVLTLTYSADGDLAQVRDPQGRTLVFLYGRGGHTPHAVLTPLGRIDYTHDPQRRLVQVERHTSDGTLRTTLYHYEASRNGGHANALTGISRRSTDPTDHHVVDQRLSTYAYDRDGMAVLTTRGLPRKEQNGQPVPGTGIEQLGIEWIDKPLPGPDHTDALGEVHPSHIGRARLTNSLGQHSELQSAVIAGHFRLLQITGAGCSTCGPADRRYTYNAAGQLLRTIRLDAAGQPLTAEVTSYDAHGRVARTGRQAIAGAVRPVTEWTRRYAYADVRYADGSVSLAAQPSLVAEPSVSAGQEHTFAFERNAYGQVTRVTETGYLPNSDARAATALQRSTTYDYATVHGHSLLVRIDGPLANGPKGDASDSDVTQLGYDEAGDHLVRIVSPGGGVVRTSAYTDAGRPSTIFEEDARHVVRHDLRYAPDGAPLQHDETAWLRNLAGQVLDRDVLHRSTRYERDAAGRATSIVRPDGTRVSTAYDLAGHAIRVTFADGSQVDVQRDSEGRAVSAERRMAPSDAPLQMLQLARDAVAGDRLTGIADDLGVIAQFDYGTDARPAAVQHANGATTAYTYDAFGVLMTQTLAAGTADALERRYTVDLHGEVVRIAARQMSTGPLLHAQGALYDDFGRKVVAADPEHGVTRHVWDAADRLVASADGGGVVTWYRYDLQGHVVERGLGRGPALVRYRYLGTERVDERQTDDGRFDHATEVRQLVHDAFGRVVHEAHWLAEIAGSVINAGGSSRDASAGSAVGTVGAVANGASTPETERRGRLTIVDTSYDPQTGRRTSTTTIDPQQRRHRVDYAWDATTGQATGIRFNGETVVDNVARGWLGAATDLRWANGLVEHSVRDARGRLTDRTVSDAQGPAAALDQHWTYDASDRLQRRTVASATRDYQHDVRNRLVAETGNGTDRLYAYDPLDNRVADWVGDLRRRYLQQANQLVAVESRGADAGRFYAYDSRGAVASQRPLVLGSVRAATLRDSASRPLRRTAEGGGMEVRYRSGLHGERLAKTVAGRTTGFLYDTPDPAVTGDAPELRLSGESADDGAIVTHYLFLDGRVIARVDTPKATDGWPRRWFAVRRTVLAWFGRVPTASATIYAVHTDQRGAVVAVTDNHAHLAWQADYDAFGAATIRTAALQQNLRLPGQYADAETGTYDNLYREYDPSTGRYLSPDPLSASASLDLGTGSRLAGVNAYAYVSGNPLNRTDGQGLYESDVHYYMTYFLATIAGMNADDARMMALATQYIDDNPKTSPIPDGTGNWEMWTSTFHNQPQLKDYHFTLSGPDGITAKEYKNNTYSYPESPQLTALESYALSTTSTCNTTKNQSLQFMGEYLHAFEDTFSHRDKENVPIDAVWRVPLIGWGWGIGHGVYGHQPDLTYDDASSGWTTREARTMEMEEETYAKIVSYMASVNYEKVADKKGKVTKLSDPIVLQALVDFNRSKGSEENESDMAAKIMVLNTALERLNYDQRVAWAPKKDGASSGYNADQAEANRSNNFSGLKQSDYPATVLK